MDSPYRGLQQKSIVIAKKARTISEDWSSSGDSRNDENDEKERRSPRERDTKDREKDTESEIIRVFDGNASMKRRLYRTISVPKNAPAQAILEAALKTFHISDDPKNYYVAEASEFGGVASGHKNITVTSDNTTEDIIRMALKKFGMEDPDTESGQFSLIEVLLDKGVSERTLENSDRPWEIIKNSRKESLHQNQMTRYYIQQREDPHGPSISLFVGNLPTGLSQRQYEKILLDIVSKQNKWVRFDVIYYEYGALVLDFSQAEKATRVFNILKDAVFDEKQLLVLLLPNIQPHMIPDNTSPLLVFVNVKSGGCQGLNLITAFRKLLNPHQVFNLENGGPLPGLYVFRNVPYYKILACGGDGTVGWVLSCLDNVGQDAICQSPPLSILPLGTGNDLARVLRWGPGYTQEDPLNYLRDVIDAEDIKLDRWTVIFHPNEKEQDDLKVAIANDTNSANTNEDTTTIFVMNTYFGLGIDADISLDFHQAREEKPDKFNSRLHNKKVWGSGANPWGPEKEDQFQKPTHYDGNLEVVGITGVVHMAQIHSGLRTGIRVAQGGHLRITLLTDLPVQVDGEPWIQPAGQVVVLRSALKATMLKKSKNKIRRRNTEPSIFFPENEGLKAQSPTDENS
ncbi:DGKQ-like protein, partial [Mya arenaria]